MNLKLEIDDKGRLTIPKEIRESLNFGKKVLIINAGDHLKIIPLPSDPFQILHGAFNIRKPFEELRKRAELLAEGEGVNRGVSI
ncbi:MAG: AbrB/MazE/SpoVT family DNA-binding domain-containing protein [Candidatus Bathyarchaeia archaeon]